MCYRMSPDYVHIAKNRPKLIIDYHYYIPYDLMHDKIFVLKCFQLHWRYLKENKLIPMLHYDWLDDYSPQFKGVGSQFYTSKYPFIIICD